MIATAATAAIETAAIDCDPSVQTCRAWRASQKESEDLINRWQTLEASLIRNHDWSRISRRQRAALPQTIELDAIDDRLDEIRDQQQKLLETLSKTHATTPRAIIAKLIVAASIIRRHENTEAHELIASVLNDLRKTAGSILE